MYIEMGVINFCSECGELRVRQVKDQLENLFMVKTPPKRNKCIFCQTQLRTTETCKREPDDSDQNPVKLRTKRYNFRRVSSSEDENESVDIHFDSVKTLDQNTKDSISTCSSSKKNTPIVIKAEKQMTRQSLPEKRKLTIVTLKPSISNTKKKLKILEKEEKVKKAKDEGKERKVTVQNGQQKAKLRKRVQKVGVKRKNDQKSDNGNKEKIIDQKLEEKKEKKKKGLETITDGEYERRLSLDERILDMVDKSVTGPKTKAMKCKECSVSFCHIQKFITHINTHLDEKLNIPCPFVCPVCSRREKTFMALDYHMIAHRKERPYSCDWPGCSWKFTCQKYLKKHIERHKGNKSYTARYKQLKKFKCSSCEYAATSKKVLEFHENTHTNARPFKCEFCDRRFNNSRNKEIHERVVHSNSMDNHVMCDLCGAFFKGDLKKHKRIHSGEKPYTCEHCGYRSNRADNLRKHLRIHQGKNKHKCSDCDMTFHSKEAYKNHEAAVHTSKIPLEIAMHISKNPNMYSEIAKGEGNVPVQVNNSTVPESTSLQKPTTKLIPILLAQNNDAITFHGPPEETSNQLLPANTQSPDPNTAPTRDQKDSPDSSTPNHQHLRNFPLLINHPQVVEGNNRQYEHSARPEEHESQLRSQHTPPISENESVGTPLQDQQESVQSAGHDSHATLQTGTVGFGGHGHLIRLPEGHVNSGNQRIPLRLQEGSVESAGHGTSLRLQGGHTAGCGPPLRPNQGIQVQGHGVHLRPNQAPLSGQGLGTPLRPPHGQGPFPNERSQSEWITAINLLQHLNQM